MAMNTEQVKYSQAQQQQNLVNAVVYLKNLVNLYNPASQAITISDVNELKSVIASLEALQAI